MKNLESVQSSIQTEYEKRDRLTQEVKDWGNSFRLDVKIHECQEKLWNLFEREQELLPTTKPKMDPKTWVYHM